MKPHSLVIIASCLLIVAASQGQSRADRPPGVDENHWVPLSDVAGIVLTNAAGMPSVGRFDFNDDGTVEPQVVQRSRGTLAVKFGGAWTLVDLEPPPARLQQLF
jgi:hypothetical protein